MTILLINFRIAKIFFFSHSELKIAMRIRHKPRPCGVFMLNTFYAGGGFYEEAIGVDAGGW